MSKAETIRGPNGTILPSRGVSTSEYGLYELKKHHVTNGVGRLTEGIMTKGQVSYVEYDDGKKYLDFSSGIGVSTRRRFLFLFDIER